MFLLAWDVPLTEQSQLGFLVIGWALTLIVFCLGEAFAFNRKLGE